MIIGLIAPAYSGKTTVAQIIRDDYGFRIKSCANRLKQLHPKQTGQSKEEWRTELQKLGAELRKDYGETFLLRNLIRNSYRGSDYVIDDLRLISEVRYMQRNNFPVIKILADFATRKSRISGPLEKFLENLCSITEMEAEAFQDTPYIIHNNRDMDIPGLRKQVKKVMGEIVRRETSHGCHYGI